MSNYKLIGLYWGERSILCVEVLGHDNTRILSIPVEFNPDKIMPPQLPAAANKAGEVLKNFLANNRIQADDFNVALPSKDIIFRTFVIPWMPANEIKGAVDFEAGKYIPFSLEELRYSYHVVQQTEDSVKRLRIIFVAIRNDTLETYKNILGNAALNVKSIEPAQVALIRTLTMNNAIGESEVGAIVEQQDTSGKITIVHNRVPLFVREFQVRLPSGTPMNPAQAEANKQNQFVNEIRISLDYFARQDSALAANKIILISDTLNHSLVDQIRADLNVADVLALSSKQLIGNKDAININYIAAFGAAVFGEVDLDLNINFSDAAKRSRGRKRKKTAISFNVKAVLPALLISIGLVGGILYYTQSKLSQTRAEIAQLKTELGDKFVDMDTETIEMQNAKVIRKQKNYEEVRIESAIAHFMQEIPPLLPDGAWLDEFRVSYKETGFIDKPVISINGYVYDEVKNEQFRLVYRLQKGLQESPVFSEAFENIDLLTTETQQLEGFDVTYFKLRCE